MESSELALFHKQKAELLSLSPGGATLCYKSDR